VATPNRLAGETSPYLRQHATNPVDWYPWGDEAFAAARTRDVPILLSVGYSACHWCHVMAHESFEDEATAALMNELFVNVKVDREERPDVDAVYMDAVQAMTGSGGWPMTVFLAPDGRPFFGGTYFPRPPFVDLLRQVATVWHTRRDELEGQADRLAEAVRHHAGFGPSGRSRTGGEFPPALLDGAYHSLRAAYDPEWGGFGRAPKFPQPAMIDLALRGHRHRPEGGLLAMATTTLDAMASGGIYDHLGGGFARYSTDRSWLVPHFEKMLYDNALLSRVYLHAWQVTGEARYLQVVDETLGYLLAPPVRSPAGGLHSAEDADSEGVEGRFYVWSADEVRAVGGDVAVAWYGVTDAGNWEGANILWRPVRGDLLRPPEVDTARVALASARAGRVRPGLDDKVITEWNAMAVAALAEAGGAAGRPDWLDAAIGVAEFLVSTLRRPGDGRWLRSWQGGRAGRNLAYAVDYAWLVEAFTRLSEATGQARWMTEARGAADSLLGLFWDDAQGGLFTTGSDAERLIVRSKDTYDGATPSANSVAAVALIRLAALTGSDRFAQAGRRILELIAPVIAAQPLAATNFLAAVDEVESGVTEIAVTGDRPDLVAAVQARYLPNAVLAWGEPYPSPLWAGRDGSATAGLAFVCRDYACLAPVGEVADLADLLATTA
jgi:uncharacterized protein YyaL (SSP411 family)